MKKAILLLCLLLIGLTSGGCALTQQPEHQAYAVCMGIDRAKDGGLELWVQVPTIGGSSSDEGGSSDASKYELFSAAGENIPIALDLLRSTMPSRLQLSLIKSIIVAEEVARTESFRDIVDQLTMTYRIYGSAAVIITRGTAKQFLEAQKPSIGIRLSTSVMAALEQYHSSGYVPLNTLYGLFCADHSIYSDPVLTLAATGPGGEENGGERGSGGEEGQDGQSQGGSSDGQPGGLSGEGQPPSPPSEGTGPMSDQGDSYPGNLPRTGPNKNQYMGCALMRDGQMVGMLDGESSRWLSILRQDVTSISYQVQGRSIQLSLNGRPKIVMDMKPEGMSVNVELAFNSYELIKQPDSDAIEAQVTKDIQEMFTQCQQAGVEPLNLAELAAIHFSTAQSFTDYRFRDKFCQAPVTIKVKVIPPKAD